MELSYDPRYNIAYIRFRTGATEEVESIRVSEDMVIDIAPDGTVFGIELLDTTAVLGPPDGGDLEVRNDATGERATISLVRPSAA